MIWNSHLSWLIWCNLGNLRISCCIYNICHYSGSCWKLSCSCTIKHQIAHALTANKDCVHYIINCKKRMLVCDHNRAYHCTDTAILFLFACSKQLNTAAKNLCVYKISWCDLCNTLSIYILVIYIFAKCKWGQNCNLSACIMTLNICRWVSLCIASLLCILKDCIIIKTIFTHLG